MTSFSRANAAALAYAAARAEAVRERARTRLTELLAGHEEQALMRLTSALCGPGVLTLNFHPDRLLADGRSVAEHLLAEGRYRNQFETGISNGGLTAHAGGARDRWEHRLFGGAYAGDVEHEERPKYGALNLLRYADGASPRFGCCYFELHAHAAQRCTLSWGDSHQEPEHVGTFAACETLLVQLLEAAARERAVFASAGLDVHGLLRRLCSPEHASPRDPAQREHGRALDTYIEVQHHGAIDLAEDVSTLVIDPCFRGTDTGEQLRALCERYAIALHEHPGFVLRVDAVPDDFRGPRMRPLAARIDRQFLAHRGEFDAASLGLAAQSLRREPAAWSDWGTFADTLQQLKQLWHVLVQFGRPRRAQ